ncbi:MAG: bifunctional ornithine acetyltransferase/N-acetylglutamate synthase [bacterium]
MKIINGTINSPKGFKSAGNFIGIKKQKKDLAIIYSEVDAVTAGVLTLNKVKAACVVRNQEILNSIDKIRAIVINSGNANACTGEEGKQNNVIMAQTLAKSLDIEADKVITASTGVIGVQLDTNIIVEGIKQSAKLLDINQQAGLDAAEAIMTTDTFTKNICVQIEIDKKLVTLSGIAKGSGMIHPNMATMLGFITTDAKVSQSTLNNLLKEIVDDTYNMISVDGDTSTNDMVIVMANGASECSEITENHSQFNKFKEAFYYVNEFLAKQIISDGEGATKFLEVSISGANSKDNAKKLAKSIISSSLVKAAFFGCDANWGRILAAMGYSEADFNPQSVNISFKSEAGLIDLMKNGVPISFDEEIALKILKPKHINILISLSDGNHKAKAWGCDLSYEYVKINGEYRS